MTYAKKIIEEQKERTKRMLELQKEVVSNQEYEEIIQKYKMDKPNTKFTDSKHKIIVGAASSLLFGVINGGGTAEEVKTAIINSMVCMDAKKHNLDWAKWKRDNNISELIKKYELAK